MVRKHVTLKDIAQEAGVSIATVSYVISDRKDQKISEAKRKKILQLANLYHYVKNPSAAYLVSGRHNVVSLLLPSPSGTLEAANQMMVFEAYSKEFSKEGLRLCLENRDVLPDGRGVDAIFTIGLDEARFLEVGDNVYVPMIAIDSFLNHFLFNQVTDDYPVSNQPLVSLPVESLTYRSHLESHFTVHYVKNLDEALEAAASISNPFLRDPALVAVFQEKGLPYRDISSIREKKVKTSVDTVIAAIKAEKNSEHITVD